MTIIIRSARASDGEALLPLVQHFVTSFVVDTAAFSDALTTLLQASHAHLSVAEVDSELIGYVLGFEHMTFYANGRVAWVEELMVRAENRRQGIGRLLMGTFEAWAKARQAKVVALATRRAGAFYTALGYEESATYFRRIL